jgi:hypothetical protein
MDEGSSVAQRQWFRRAVSFTALVSDASHFGEHVGDDSAHPVAVRLYHPTVLSGKPSSALHATVAAKPTAMHRVKVTLWCSAV